MAHADIISVPDHVNIQGDSNGWEAMERDSGGHWAWKGVNVETAKEKEQLLVTLYSGKIPVKRIILKWRVNLLPGARMLGDHWERGYGDLEWRGVVPERIMPWYFLMYDGKATHGYGVRTQPNAMCFWMVDEKYISLCLDVRCGGEGVTLGGRTLEVAAVISRQGKENETPFAAASAFAKMLCDNPLLPEQPVYGGNNWYYAYGKSSHEQILRDAELIASLSPANGNRPFMVIDDGWQLCHYKLCNGGPWSCGNYQFPDMQRLAGQMKVEGTKPGLWIRPLMTSEKVPESWQLPERRFRAQERDQYLDPSVAEVLDLVSRDISRIASWGYKLVKHDFSTYDILGRWGFEMDSRLTNDGWHFSDRSKTTAEVITGLYRTIRRAAGNMLVLGCNTVGHLGAGIFELQRTGDDISGVQWERTRKMGINTLAFRMNQHGAFFAADADCAAITEKVPWHLSEQWLRLLSLSGTPLFVSAAPEAMGKEQTDAVKKAFDAASRPAPAGEPLDWAYSSCPAKWKLGKEIVEFDWHGNNKSIL